MPAFDDVPLVNAAATYDAETGRLYLSVVNCSIDEPMRVELAGISGAPEVECFLVAGASPLSTNTFAEPDTIGITGQTMTMINCHCRPTALPCW